jgi:hypothetical protein
MVKIRHNIIHFTINTCQKIWYMGNGMETTVTPLEASFVKLKVMQHIHTVTESKEVLGVRHEVPNRVSDTLEYIDIRPFAPETKEPYVSYIAAAGNKVFACLRGGHVIFSEDYGLTWSLEESIEQDGAPEKERSTYLAAITDMGTVLVIGELRLRSKVYIAIWRRAKNADSFSRAVLCEKNGGPPASVSVGRLGIFFTQYESLNIFRSADDGLSWIRITLPYGKIFKNHVHCVWAHPSQPYVYVSGGDAGPRYGEKPAASWVGLASVVRSSDIRHWTKVFTEQPGERIVAITGNQRKRFFGNEINSGGFSTYDDANYEVIFGRQTLGFINFDTFQYTPEGLLLAGTCQYRRGTSAVYGHAGEIWISDDEGASFQRIRTSFSIVSALAYNNKYVFAGFGYGGAGRQLDLGTHILLFPKTTFLHGIKREKKVAKIVLNNTGQTLTRELAPGACTYQVNMAPYTQVGIIAGVGSACTLTVEANAYQDDPSFTWDPKRWVTVEKLVFDSPGIQVRQFGENGRPFAVYRVRNSSNRSAKIDQITFVGTIGEKE